MPGTFRDINTRKKNRASDLIENFMVAANGVMARALQDAKVSSIRRVVKTPKRWPRIVELAAQHGEKLPAEPGFGSAQRVPAKKKSGRSGSLRRRFAGGRQAHGARASMCWRVAAKRLPGTSPWRRTITRIRPLPTGVLPIR